MSGSPGNSDKNQHKSRVSTSRGCSVGGDCVPGTCDNIRGPWCREAQDAWRTSLGRRSGDGGSGVRGRVWKTTLDREGSSKENSVVVDP